MKVSLADLLAKLPKPAAADWPDGVPFERAMAHGTMSLELFAPRGTDHQRPHDQDEIYIVVSGTSDLLLDGERTEAKAGDAIFVRAGVDHRFAGMSEDFVTWIVFFGPEGGEEPAPAPSPFATIDA